MPIEYVVYNGVDVTAIVPTMDSMSTDSENWTFRASYSRRLLSFALVVHLLVRVPTQSFPQYQTPAALYTAVTSALNVSLVSGNFLHTFVATAATLGATNLGNVTVLSIDATVAEVVDPPTVSPTFAPTVDQTHHDAITKKLHSVLGITQRNIIVSTVVVSFVVFAVALIFCCGRRSLGRILVKRISRRLSQGNIFTHEIDQLEGAINIVDLRAASERSSSGKEWNHSNKSFGSVDHDHASVFIEAAMQTKNSPPISGAIPEHVENGQEAGKNASNFTAPKQYYGSPLMQLTTRQTGRADEYLDHDSAEVRIGIDDSYG